VSLIGLALTTVRLYVKGIKFHSFVAVSYTIWDYRLSANPFHENNLRIIRLEGYQLSVNK